MLMTMRYTKYQIQYAYNYLTMTLLPNHVFIAACLFELTLKLHNDASVIRQMKRNVQQLSSSMATACVSSFICLDYYYMSVMK